MTVIDVAQRAASRDRAPMISFRRNDADRRPARRVAMPNDGPAPDREALSDARRAALKRKTFATRAVSPINRSEIFEQNVVKSLRAIASGKQILPEIAQDLDVGPERTRDFCRELVLRGLAWSRFERREKNRTFTAFYLTDAGKAHAAQVLP